MTLSTPIILKNVHGIIVKATRQTWQLISTDIRFITKELRMP